MPDCNNLLINNILSYDTSCINIFIDNIKNTNKNKNGNKNGNKRQFINGKSNENGNKNGNKNGNIKEPRHICCVCNKEYSYYSGLWKHKKNCISNNDKPKEPRYICSVCNKEYSNYSGLWKHKKNCTLKEKIYSCSICNKEYLNYNALWKHKKKCVQPEEQQPIENTELQNTFRPVNTISNFTPEFFFEILKQSKELQEVLIQQNKELQNQVLEQQNQMLQQNEEHHKQIIELASKPTMVNSNNNNKQFNLQFFLNETCKDAMNITDFINSIKLTTDDFETTGRLGFVDGISRIFVKELKKLTTEKLPLHCTDYKRETVYIKNNDIWEKENDEKTRFKWAINRVAQLNLNQVAQWQEKYPECVNNNTRENEKFTELALVALGGRGKEQEDKFREKIMKNVLKEVVLDKK